MKSDLISAMQQECCKLFLLIHIKLNKEYTHKCMLSPIYCLKLLAVTKQI